MSVDLQPQELGFKRPFNHEVTEILKLSNPNKAPVAFKVKTTAPKQYCVRPNSGIIPPNNSVQVQVLLQAMKEDPPLDAKCRDKFLVQSAMTTSDDTNVAALWQSIEREAKSSIQERKIRVNFLSPDSAGAAVNGTPTHHEEEPPAYSSTSTPYRSPGPQSSAGPSASSQSPSESKTSATADEQTSAAGSAFATVASTIPSSEELQQQLAAAKTQIANLTSQLGDPQIRQRKVQEAGDKMHAVVQQTNESGVPVQIVAGLCLLSFLIAYLLF